MIKKNQLIETIESFPEEFTLEELVDKLILLDKIEKEIAIQSKIIP